MAAQREDFVTKILPELAIGYRDQESLVRLEDTSTWLKTLKGHRPDLNEGKKAFLADGSACINLLAEYLKLLSLKVGNECLTCDLGILYTEFMYQYNIGLDGWAARDMGNLRTPQNLRDLSQALQDLRLSRRTHDDEQKLFYEAAEKMCDREAAPVDNNVKYREIAASAWKDTTRQAGNIDSPELNRTHSMEAALRIMERKYEESILGSASLESFRDNLRSFAYLIGCPEAHSDPQRNIAQLRLFHSTQMPFLTKLQEDLQKQIDLNNKQQEIITALVFRHLIENLPPNPYNGMTSSTDRWQAYWRDMVVRENRERAAGGSRHPLEEFVDARVVDANGNITARSSQGMKGSAYRAGLELFGTLSANIHKYKGNEDGKGAYVVRDDQWGETNRSILKRLIPESFDPLTREVDWTAERTRFV